jgi:very-short-patch-repair endonuclease
VKIDLISHQSFNKNISNMKTAIALYPIVSKKFTLKILETATSEDPIDEELIVEQAIDEEAIHEEPTNEEIKKKKKIHRWTLELLKGKSDILYNGTIAYNDIDPKTLTNTSNIFPTCLICKFRWLTNIGSHITCNNGCPWCLKKLSKIRKFTLEMMEYISKRIHLEIYSFHLNDPNKIYVLTDKILLCCDKGHIPFTDTLGKIFSQAKSNKNRTKGCLLCKEKIQKQPPARWHHNLDLLKSKGGKIHNNQYDYSENKPEDIITNRSLIKIKCLRIMSNRNICNNIFSQTIHDHIDSATGCPACFKSYNITLPQFINKMEKLYKNKFLLHHLKDIDVRNNFSLPKLECSICHFIINTTHISTWLFGRRQCNFCINNELWTYEKVNRNIIIKEEEGKYTYENTILPKQITGKTLIQITCIICKNKKLDNYIFSKSIYAHFVDNSGCPKCSKCSKLSPWNSERLKIECERKEKEGHYCYKLVDYNSAKGGNTLIEIICIKCQDRGYDNFTFVQSVVDHFTCGHGCKRCVGMVRWSFEKFLEVKEDLPDAFKQDYSYDNITKEMFIAANCLTEVPIICLVCDNIFTRGLTDHFVTMAGCRYCIKSNMSKIVHNILTNLGINFKDEVKIMGLNNHFYRYDYMFTYNGVNIILETDGGQHFDFTKCWHKTDEKFIKSQQRDIYKQYYAIKNGYHIIRIDDKIPNKEIENHVKKALDLNLPCYYSTENRYQWLINGVNNYIEI